MNLSSSGGVSDPDRFFKPMKAYPQYHSTDPKSFLGVTIPAQPVADPVTSLRIGLDTLAAHPNVGDADCIVKCYAAIAKAKGE